jgi:hypothetical protein
MHIVLPNYNPASDHLGAFHSAVHNGVSVSDLNGRFTYSEEKLPRWACSAYRINVQCTDAISGETGTFLADAHHHALSPIFSSLAYLFPWMRDNGWKMDEYVDGQFIPWRAVKSF